MTVAAHSVFPELAAPLSARGNRRLALKPAGKEAPPTLRTNDLRVSVARASLPAHYYHGLLWQNRDSCYEGTASLGENGCPVRISSTPGRPPSSQTPFFPFRPHRPKAALRARSWGNSVCPLDFTYHG